MADRRVRNLKDPYPTTLEGVYEELRYWASRQSEGDPGSPHEEGVKGRLESLRDLERQFKDHKIEPRAQATWYSSRVASSLRRRRRSAGKYQRSLTI